jgi:ATP-binding cassette subfamily B protein
MDEPTSAIDPRAEFELFENFRAKIGHRAALIISHRLSTVRMAEIHLKRPAGNLNRWDSLEA